MYDYKTVEVLSNPDALLVSKYLDDIDEMNGLSQQLKANFFLTDPYSVKAYEYWSTLKNKGIRRSELSLFKQNDRTLRLDFPIYSSDHEKEFIDIISDEETVHSLRSFLRESFQDLVNVDTLPDANLSNEICIMAKQHLTKLEHRFSNFHSLSSRNKRYNVYRFAASPIGEFINHADKKEKINRERRAVGFVSNVLKR
jgi:hypothetical protein